MAVLPSYVNTARRLLRALLLVAGSTLGWQPRPPTAQRVSRVTGTPRPAPSVTAATQGSVARPYTGRRDIAGDRWTLFLSRQVCDRTVRPPATDPGVAARQGELPLPSALVQNRLDILAHAARPHASPANEAAPRADIPQAERSDQGAGRFLVSARNARRTTTEAVSGAWRRPAAPQRRGAGLRLEYRAFVVSNYYSNIPVREAALVMACRPRTCPGLSLILRVAAGLAACPAGFHALNATIFHLASAGTLSGQNTAGIMKAVILIGTAWRPTHLAPRPAKFVRQISVTSLLSAVNRAVAARRAALLEIKGAVQRVPIPAVPAT